MKAFYSVFFILVLFSSLIAYAAGGAHGVGNGAGGSAKADGEVILRDLIGSPDVTPVKVPEDFLRGTNDFQQLIRDLARVSPLFTSRVLQQLLNAHLYLTEKPLPLLPADVTGVFDDPSDVQIAIRYENDIVISMPAFRRTEQSYLLLHEALHGVVEGEGPLHHEMVRAIVREIHDQRTRLTPALIGSLEDGYGVLPFDASQRTPEQRYVAQKALLAAFGDQGSAAARALIQNLFQLSEVAPFPEELDHLVSFLNDHVYSLKQGESLRADAEALFPNAAAFLEVDSPQPDDVELAKQAFSSPQTDPAMAALAPLLTTPGLLAPYLKEDLPLLKLQKLSAQ